MDEVKRLELAIELAKIEALDRLRVAIEAKGEKGMLVKALKESSRPGANGLVTDALKTVDALLADRPKPIAAMQGAVKSAKKKS